MRLTIRVRLTLLYGGLFFAAGVVMLGVTYVLVNQNLSDKPGIAQRFSASGGEVALDPKNSPPRQLDRNVMIRGDAQADLANAEEDYRKDILNSLLTQGGIALVLVGTVAVGLGWLMADRALRPVHQVTETARRVAHSHNLTERIAYDGPRDDIRELADTFDTMLARLARSFDGQRRFVANASHELRTPLAINRTLVDVAMRRPDAGDDLRRLGETLLVVNARHERLIDGLLTLAGSENLVPERVDLDLAEVTGHVLDQAEVEAKERGITVHRMLARTPAAADPVLLERLVQNLVENAIRHNRAEDGEIWVATREEPRYVELLVANTGPPVPAYDIPAIFEPFRRLRSERVHSDRGSGLGLSIVQAVAAAHGGEVSAAPRADGGLVLTVRFAADRPIRAARAARSDLEPRRPEGSPSGGRPGPAPPR